jgi:DNA-binding SARP family transcriptional activator
MSLCVLRRGKRPDGERETTKGAKAAKDLPSCCASRFRSFRAFAFSSEGPFRTAIAVPDDPKEVTPISILQDPVSPFSIRMLGLLQIERGGVPLPRLRSRKGHWILALLLLRHPGEVERAWLAGTLWPDSPPAQALANLRNSLRDLRRALGSEAHRLLSPTPRTLALDLGGAEVDLLRFDAAVARADPASLQQAIAMYRGPLLEDCVEEWVLPERQAREQAYLGALETLAAALARGEPGAAVRFLRQAVAVDPLEERAQRGLLQALAAAGEYAAAGEVYREFRLRLHRELNAAPAPETTALFQQIRGEAREKAAHGSRHRVQGSDRDDIPEVVMGINAFTLALRAVQPEATVNVIWVNSWYDPGKEADAAKAHLDQGADIIVQHTDSPAPLQVAEERGAMAFGQASDMRRFAPNAQLTAIVDDWNDYYVRRAQAVIDGTWESHGVWMGLKDGTVVIAPYGPKVTPEAAAAADKIKADIIAGGHHPFAGPIKDRDGKERVAAGATASDEELHKMDWYVAGVQG